MTFEEWWSAQSADTKIDNAKYAAEAAWEAAYKEAILALSAVTPEGYVLVPIEPTSNMLIDGLNEHLGGTPRREVIAIYKAMIQAAQGQE